MGSTSLFPIVSNEPENEGLAGKDIKALADLHGDKTEEAVSGGK